MSSITAAKLDGVGVGRPGTRREYVRKDGGEAYAYVSSYLVLLEHGGHSVKGEGIDGQATRVGGGLYMRKCTHPTRFLGAEQTRDVTRHVAPLGAER